MDRVWLQICLKQRALTLKGTMTFVLIHVIEIDAIF